ncbi:MAG: PAS domain S-box protein, partial [Desulfobacteraceae bacterium]
LSIDQMRGITSLDPGWKSIHEDGSPFPGETHPAMVALSSGQPVKNTVMGVFHPEKNDYTWININATPLFRPGAAAPHEVYTTFEDITERKKAEKALLESESLFKNLFEHHAAVQLIIDPSNGSIVDANAAASKFYGWTREQLRQMRIQDINTLSPEEIIKEMEKARVHERIHFEFRHRRSDGSIRDVEVFSSKIEAKGKDILHSIIHDITDRRRLEEELLKIDKLESVGILAGGIAHDFNNLLTSIIGNISIARMRVKSEHKVLELLNAAETASMRARRLTGQLLTFAKGGKPVKETVSIQKLIKESSLFILRNSKSRCEFLVAEDLWPVDADAGQLSQVFSNILINADQSMPEGGIILITAENLMPEKINDIPVDPGRYIRISIKDQGAGIAGKNLSKIFDPYFTTKTEGSGLGLATAYSIIKKHDGHISVDSEPGAGATFHIYLPASGKEIPEKEESADPLKGTGKILVMDDDTLLKEMIGQMLELLGYQAEFAKDGAEAILLFRKARESGKPYDTAILDLTIPGGMGGKEAIKKLLEIDPELKAVVFSGYSDDPVMSNYREYGFRGMMSKPFDMQKLSKVLHDVIKGQ